MDRQWLETAGYGVPLVWIAVIVALYDVLPPWVRLFAATAALLWSIKVGAVLVLHARSISYDLSPVETLLFWTVWPTVRPDRFSDASGDRLPDSTTFVTGYVFLLAGVLLAVATAVAATVLGVELASWLFVLAVLLVVHQGVARLLPFFLRWAGYPVPGLFDDPLASRSIGEFWSRRWNLPFVYMNRLFVTRPFGDRIGPGWAALLAFLVSGVLHELAISYAAGGGWGLPMLYFVVQATLYSAERRVLPDVESIHWLPQKLWVWGGLLVPVPLLFHGPFRHAFVVPVIEGLRSVLVAQPLAFYVDTGLWAAAFGHFLVLAASVQVPDRLEWRTDLETLQPFNRKLLWTYGGFIVLVIVSFGVLTAVFHDEFLTGNPVALGLCAFIAVFWGARILVDAAYFSHDDWPEGLEFVVGHAMLTSLFLVLVSIYAGTLLFHTVPP